jgi:S1-C subfamily serine protease
MFALVPLLLLPGQIPTADSEDFPAKVQTAAVAATVQLVNRERSGVGSGVVLGRSGPFVYVLTAAHVVGRAEQVDVRTFSAESYPRPAAVYKKAKVVARSERDDLALVRVVTDEPPPGAVKICPQGAAPDGPNFAALSVGCKGRDAPTCRPVRVAGKKHVRKKDEDKAVWCWELDAELERGRSGGPLLDRKGRLLGITSLASGGHSYCCHLDAMHALLRDNGLEHLAR